MMWNGGDFGSFGMGFGFHWLVMVVFWGLVVWGAVAVIRAMLSPRLAGGTRPEDPALAILRERYARGELNGSQFEQMRKELS